MMNYSVKKGDYVKVIAGNDKGKMGQIIGVDKTNGRVALEGKDIATAKKAIKSKKASDKSGIITMPKTIAISNVMPVCASCGKATRVRFQIVDGKKVRVCECGAVLETKKVATKEEKKAKATVRKKVSKPVATDEVVEDKTTEEVVATEEVKTEAVEAVEAPVEETKE
jgi:large subunit ribosomal protein L24